MLAKLKEIFSESRVSGGSGTQNVASEDAVRLACAVLMTEVATIDQQFDESELKVLHTSLQKQFSLSNADTQELVELAETSRHESTSLHEFTRLINAHLSAEQKFTLLKSMWSVAFADGELDKYEEHIIRRAADLIHVGHSEFIRAKIAAKN